MIQYATRGWKRCERLPEHWKWTLPISSAPAATLGSGPRAGGALRSITVFKTHLLWPRVAQRAGAIQKPIPRSRDERFLHLAQCIFVLRHSWKLIFWNASLGRHLPTGDRLKRPAKSPVGALDLRMRGNFLYIGQGKTDRIAAASNRFETSVFFGIHFNEFVCCVDLDLFGFEDGT